MSKNPLAIVILAAGKGTRMKSALPKAMHTLAGLPMINWLIKAAEELSPEKIVVVTGPNMPDLEEAAQPHETITQDQQNGTAGAVRTAMPALKGFDGDVLILLGDTPLLSASTMRDLIKARGDDGMAVLGTEVINPAGLGRMIITEDGTLHRIVEEKDASDEEKVIRIINTGAFCVDGKKLSGWLEKIDNKNAAGEYYLTDLPEIAAEDGAQARVCITLDYTEVQGCNSRVDLAELERTAQGRLREVVMLTGVTMLDPSTVYLHHDTVIARDVEIEPNVFFGPGVEVGEGTVIKAFTHIENTKIGRDVSIGPFARLRPGSELGDDVRIGNFVEVKKSKVGARSKINHLAYVGDTQMGEDTNFSAGAITVNYDGFEKHETVIGKGVMVGSNVNLVAPLTVEDGAFIAAGSTITKDVPADALSIARDDGKIHEGWAAKYRKRKEKKKSA